MLGFGPIGWSPTGGEGITSAASGAGVPGGTGASIGSGSGGNATGGSGTPVGSISQADINAIAAAVLVALQGTTIPVDAVKMNGTPILGDGSAGNKWRGV